MPVSMHFEIFGDVQLERDILRVSFNANDFTPIFEALADDFYQIEEEQFESQGGRSGGWAPLAPYTLEKKRRLGHDLRILHETLAMRKSLTDQNARGAVRRIGPDEMFVGTSVRSERGFPYPAAHQRPLKGQIRRRPVEFSKADRIRWMRAIQRFLVTGGTIASPAEKAVF